MRISFPILVTAILALTCKSRQSSSTSEDGRGLQEIMQGILESAAPQPDLVKSLSKTADVADLFPVNIIEQYESLPKIFKEHNLYPFVLAQPGVVDIEVMRVHLLKSYVELLLKSPKSPDDEKSLETFAEAVLLINIRSFQKLAPSAGKPNPYHEIYQTLISGLIPSTGSKPDKLAPLRSISAKDDAVLRGPLANFEEGDIVLQKGMPYDQLDLYYRVLLHPAFEESFLKTAKAIGDKLDSSIASEHIKEKLERLVKVPAKSPEDSSTANSTLLKRALGAIAMLQENSIDIDLEITKESLPIADPDAFFDELYKAIAKDMNGPAIKATFQEILSTLRSRNARSHIDFYLNHMLLLSEISAQYHRLDISMTRHSALQNSNIDSFKAAVKPLATTAWDSRLTKTIKFVDNIRRENFKKFPSQITSNACVGFEVTRDMISLTKNKANETLNPWYAYGLMSTHQLYPDILKTGKSLAQSLKEKLGPNRDDWLKKFDNGVKLPDELSTLQNFGISNHETELNFINFIPNHIHETGVVKLDQFAMHRISHGGTVTSEDIRELLDNDIAPVLLIDTDRSKQYLNWVRYQPSGYMSHAVRVLGYGTGVDVFDGVEKDFFVIEDPLQYRLNLVSQYDILNRIQGLYKTLSIKEIN